MGWVCCFFDGHSPSKRFPSLEKNPGSFQSIPDQRLMSAEGHYEELRSSPEPE